MDVSIDGIRKTIEDLCQFENRIAGTTTEREAADYLKGKLSEIGYDDVKEHEFPVIAWEPQEATISLVSPDEATIDCALFPNSLSTEGRVRLVDLESKPEQKTDKLAVYGLTEWGESLIDVPIIPYDKALDQGLDGLIISSPAEGELFKVRVGFPGKELQIPIFSVSKETGESLREMMQESKVILNIKSVAKRGPSKSCNLEAVLEGSNPDFEIIVSAHYDAWFSGAADNAAPVAIVLETARLLREHLSQGGILKRTIRFLLYGAEESGSERYYFWLNGSRSYVESQESLDKFALVVNLDSIGYAAPNHVETTFELFDFARSVSNALKQEERFGHTGPPGAGSDHWFFTIGGVPTISLSSWPSHLYHTQKDTPEVLDYESIQVYTEYVVNSLIEFSNAEVLPLNIMTLLDLINERIEQFTKIEGNPFGLQTASGILREILKEKDAFEQYIMNIQSSGNKENIAKLNDFLIATTGKMNKTIGPVPGEFQAKYLPRLELIHDYMKIDSVIRTLKEMPIMKVSSRTRVRYRVQDDIPYKWAEVENPIEELRTESKKLADLISEEIEVITSHLRETLTALEALLTMPSE